MFVKFVIEVLKARVQCFLSDIKTFEQRVRMKIHRNECYYCSIPFGDQFVFIIAETIKDVKLCLSNLVISILLGTYQRPEELRQTIGKCFSVASYEMMEWSADIEQKTKTKERTDLANINLSPRTSALALPFHSSLSLSFKSSQSSFATDLKRAAC